MKPLLRNIIALPAGIIAGGLLNSGIVFIGNAIFPTGIDPNDYEAYAQVIPTLSMEYFIFPFLAHALGTLFGAYIASKVAVSYQLLWSLLIGGFFLVGGITAISMFGGPTWFMILDLTIAYIPMAYLGYKFASK
ncbi:hypothetical protein AAT17_03435 [Nonlabens sp. MIC269]|uniref:hypothetical protein n=1 Tax=Nonlabens sp. MIC269 TaxID=1476901 RepID=UPI0007219822|nr:hypothetical protein [Nonlabens sp. MIC269]ALM20352.1 hypothetical protein AAT17_03435 [Nonlabens sp. MIC269]